MQRAMIVRHAGEVAAISFAFVQPAFLVVITVGATANPQRFVGAFERYFRFVLAAATGGDDLMAGDAFSRARSRRKAQIQVAALGGELAEHAHGNGRARCWRIGGGAGRHGKLSGTVDTYSTTLLTLRISAASMVACAGRFGARGREPSYYPRRS